MSLNYQAWNPRGKTWTKQRFNTLVPVLPETADEAVKLFNEIYAAQLCTTCGETKRYAFNVFKKLNIFFNS